MQHRSSQRRLTIEWPLVALSMLVFTLTTTPAVAHPFHVSLAEAEWNAKTGRLEVALKVHATDLEKALRRRTKKPVDLDKSPDVDRLISAYLNHVFRVQSPKGQACTIKWVGKEVTLKSAWLYFELPLPQGIEGMRFSNQMFFELLSNQVNTINFKQGRKKLTLRFTRQSATHVAKFPPPQKDALRRTQSTSPTGNRP
ncbi:MAG: DUF6702 family protein [Planctomycetaceae bacterium]